MKLLTTVWKDPVWSKVLATIIVSIGVLSLNYNSVLFDIEYIKVIANKKIEVWIVLCIICGIFIILFSVLRFKNIYFKYDLQTFEMDKAFFNTLRSSIMTQEIFMAPREHTFSSAPFDSEKLFQLIDILETSKSSDFEFINPRLDKLKERVIYALMDLNSAISSNIFGAHRNGWLCVPREWDDAEIIKASKEICLAEDTLVYEYDKLIRTGRRILKV